MVLREIKCRWCDIFFCICQSCWRGQVYCSDECRIYGRRKAHREAQKRYRQTAEGQSAHREAERKRRMRIVKKNMDDRGSTHISLGCKISLSYPDDSYKRVGIGNKGRCHFCGSYGTIVNKFPRRGYGSRNLRSQMISLCKKNWKKKTYRTLKRDRI